MDKSENRTKLYARWFFIRLAMVVFDIFAVNAAYFCALVVRFYVASEFNVWAVRYIPAFADFAPFYTLVCIVVFALFRLYNSRWKYAGLNDLNRIALANLVTCIVQVAGSMLFFMRMPVTYYLIGAVIQFTLITISRFSYRFFIFELGRVRKLRSKTNINVMVVGVGETSRIVIKHLEGDADNAAHPVCLVDFRGNEFGSRIEVVFSNNDDMALGALDAYKNMNYTEAAYPVVFGIDGTKAGLEAVMDSEIAGTVYNDKEGQAGAMARIALALLTGEGLEDVEFQSERCVYLPYEKVTKGNVSEYLMRSR